MAGYVDIPKFKDVRRTLKTHPTRNFPKLSLKGKTTIAIHHSLTKQGASGSNAEGYARYHVDAHGWPGIGYSYVIEPDGTVKFCNDIELRTYHVGNHNNYAVGICLTGDFRTEEPTAEQKRSLRNLVDALKQDYPHLKYVKGHNEFSGYEWKRCPEFDYKAVLAQKRESGGIVAGVIGTKYEIQEGDTFYSIAKGLDGISADDLIDANPSVKPTELRVGETAIIPGGEVPKEKPKKESSSEVNLSVDGKWGSNTTKALQKALGTPQDGVISNQSHNDVTKRIVSGITFGKGGSIVVKALQKKIGAKADGLLGPNTVRKLQAYLGTPVDGIISDPSMMVEKLQRQLNSGKF